VFYFQSSSATLWFCCLVRFLILLPLVGRRFLPGGIADFFHVVSILPLGEVIVERILATTRNSTADTYYDLLVGIKMVWLCYGVIFQYPKIAKHTSYSVLIASWCTLWCIHFVFKAFTTKTRRCPSWLLKLQYSNFYLTYPSSWIAEFILIFLSLKFVENDIYELFLQAVIVSYIPVGYFSVKYLRNRRMRKCTQVLKKRGITSTDSTTTFASSSAQNRQPVGINQI
jgi:hypothetical protein